MQVVAATENSLLANDNSHSVWGMLASAEATPRELSANWTSGQLRKEPTLLVPGDRSIRQSKRHELPFFLDAVF
jgi:hypothetical protein